MNGPHREPIEAKPFRLHVDRPAGLNRSTHGKKGRKTIDGDDYGLTRKGHAFPPWAVQMIVNVYDALGDEATKPESFEQNPRKNKWADGKIRALGVPLRTPWFPTPGADRQRQSPLRPCCGRSGPLASQQAQRSPRTARIRRVRSAREATVFSTSTRWARPTPRPRNPPRSRRKQSTAAVFVC